MGETREKVNLPLPLFRLIQMGRGVKGKDGGGRSEKKETKKVKKIDSSYIRISK